MRPHWFLLYPFSLLYDGITRLRNRMFDLGQKKSVIFEIPTIVVGNLSMGGTGKTPMVEFLVEYFKSLYEVAILSRGYGRKTTGYFEATEASGPDQIGDEPYQMYTKYGGEVTVAVGEQRILAIPKIIADHPATELVVLDDAFQHRYVKGDFNILLTTFQRPFFWDHVLPLGTLREHPKGAQRADVVVVTKCPDSLGAEDREKYREEMKPYVHKTCPVIFAGLQYGRPYPIGANTPEDVDFKTVILVSGIAHAEVLRRQVEKDYHILEELEFGDHYRYTEKDARNLAERYWDLQDKNPVILTTEKDAVKLKADKFLQYLKEIPIFALPVQVKLDEKEKHALLELASKAIRNKGYQSER